jgi:uncharacterized protein (TIGR03083 family)
MALDRVGALRQERDELLAFCRDLDGAAWEAPSKADGWCVQDVVAHMGSAYHALCGPAALKLLRSNDIERTNDVFVDERRGWSPVGTLAEYERWSGRVIGLLGLICRTPLARVPTPVAELGSFPAGLLPGAMVFDHHTHLRHDIAPALSRPVPASDPDRMAVVLEWMLAVLGNQLRAQRPAPVDRPVAITLEGPGGGSWLVRPDAAITPESGSGTSEAAVHISGLALEFPEWGTKRADWRDRDVTLRGDVEYGTVFLDAVNVV